MSQWSEKIPKESEALNLSKTVSSTRYLFTSFSEVWIQINNFRKSSKKFIIDLLTKNIALNLSGAIFFVGLGNSLKWWYKDQFFVVLLKQNLPALSESQQNISWETAWETGKSILNNESKILLQLDPSRVEEYKTWTPLIDSIDLYANHIRVKFKQPWQKHASERFIGVFGEPAQANANKQVLTIPFTGEKDWWKENPSVSYNALPDEFKKKAAVPTPFTNQSSTKINNITPSSAQPKFSLVGAQAHFSERHLNEPVPCEAKEGVHLRGLRYFAKFSEASDYTLYTPEKPIFPKKWFKLSPHNICFLNEEVIFPSLGSRASEQKSPFTKMSAPLALHAQRGHVARVDSSWGSWRAEAAKRQTLSRYAIHSSASSGREQMNKYTYTDKLSYPLKLTKKLAGWQPFPNLLVLNSYLDEIPYKLENALQSYFPNKNSQLLFLSTSFRKSINSHFAINDVVIKRNDEVSNTLLCKAFAKSMTKSMTPSSSVLQTKDDGVIDFVIVDYSPAERQTRRGLPSWQIKLLPHALQSVQSNEGHPLKWTSACVTELRGQEHKSQKLTEDLISFLFEESNKYDIKDVMGDENLLQHQLGKPSGHAKLEENLLQLDPSGRAQLEELVIEKDDAVIESTGVKTSLLYRLKNSWVSDSFPNYKTSETEKNETEKTLDLFKETFLVPTKANYASSPTKLVTMRRSETYLKKLHLFETKKLLQNQFASLINSLVEKSEASVEKKKHSDANSHAGDESRSAKAKRQTSAAELLCEAKGVKVAERQRSVRSSAALRNGVNDIKDVIGDEVINDVNAKQNYHNLVDVTTKILAVAERRKKTQKGIILPPALQAQYVINKNDYSLAQRGTLRVKASSSNLRFPPVLTGLAELAKQRKPYAAKESVTEGYWGTEVDRLTQLFAYSTIANAADAEGLDPLLLLNTLGFTFNNFSPLTNPPILLSYDKLGVVSNGAPNRIKNNSTTVYNDYSLAQRRTLRVKASPSDAALASRLAQREEIENTGGNFAPLPNSATQVEVHFSERPLCSEASESDAPLRLQQREEIEDLQRERGNLQQEKIVTQIENLQQEESVVEKLKAKPVGKLKDLTNTILNKVDRFTTSSNDDAVIISFNAYLSGVPEGSDAYPKGVQLLQKEKKIEALNKINVVDKDINFDKNSRYMSGYIYPDIAQRGNNSLKAFLYQWLSKNKNGRGNFMPWFSSPYHYLNEKSIASQLCKPEGVSLHYSKNVQSCTNPSAFCSEASEQSVGNRNFAGLLYNYNKSKSEAKKGSTLLTSPVKWTELRTKGENLESYNLLLQQQEKAIAELNIAEESKILEKKYANFPISNYGRGNFHSSKKEDEAVINRRFSSSLIGSKEKTGNAVPFPRYAIKNQFLENNHYIVNMEVPYKKFNHCLAKFPGFSDPTQFFTTLPQISCGNENLVPTKLNNVTQLRTNWDSFAKSQEKSILHPEEFDASLLQTEYLPGNRSWQSKEGRPLKWISAGVAELRGSAAQLRKPLRDKEIEDFASVAAERIDRFSDTAKNLSFDATLHEKVSRLNNSINIIDKSEINKKFIQKNGCDSRKVAYSGIVVRRNKRTKDFQPAHLPFQNPATSTKINPHLNSLSHGEAQYKKEIFKEKDFGQAGAIKSSIWGTLFLGPENPLTNRQCHFFGQKQLSTLDTNSLQRDYLRQLGKEILAQSNTKGYTELSKFSSIERTKILSLSKKVNSFFFKKRKYSYLLEPKDQWHLLFQEQLCSALEDCKKYPIETISEKLDPDGALSGRIKVSAPLVMARFPKKLVSFNTNHDKLASRYSEGSNAYPFRRYGFILVELLEKGLSWRPVCHLQKSFIYAPLKDLHDSVIIYNYLRNSSNAILPRTKFSPFYWASQTLRFSSDARPEGVSAVARDFPPYPLFTERFSEEINAIPCLNKNSLFYSAADSFASHRSSVHFTGLVTNPVKIKTPASGTEIKVAVPQGGMPTKMKPSRAKQRKGWKNMRNNLLGVQNMCTSLLTQEPLNCNSWAVLNQWVFLIALLFWVEQTLLNNVFPALFALEQILLSAAGLRTGENNRTHVLRISKNETPKFQNLAGIDGLLGELSELVLFLRGQRNLGVSIASELSFWNKWNKKNSYGVLLTGSPGTGKTFLVRALANEAKVPVLILSASTLATSKLNNNKPSWSIRYAFKRAKQLAPCILFIDEIDALGKSRGKIVTDINEIVADTNTMTKSSISVSFLTHKRMTESAAIASPIAQQMFSYEQFGQNCSNFNATLLNKWEFPLQSTILQESNEINQNSLCEEKLVDLLKITSTRGTTAGGVPQGLTGGTHDGAFTKGSPTEFKKESTNETTYSHSDKGIQQLPTLEKEMIRGKFGPLTQLLVSMDGVSSFSGVLIMGATNRPELLDPALTRPGRFEKIIRIDKPSEQNRIEILQLYSQNLGVQQQIPWSYLATRTIGLTTADLAVAMNYSSLRAIIQNSVHTLETIEYGLNCITRL